MFPSGCYCLRMDTHTVSSKVASKVRGIAAEKMLSTGDLAERSGIPYTTLRRKMRGEREFSVTELGLVARALDVDIEALVREAFAEAVA